MQLLGRLFIALVSGDHLRYEGYLENFLAFLEHQLQQYIYIKYNNTAKLSKSCDTTSNHDRRQAGEPYNFERNIF